MNQRRIAVLLLLLGILFSSDAMAQDWPQPLGPERNCQSSFVPPADWKLEEVELSWQVPAGQGYAGPIVSENKAYLWDRQGQRLRMRAIRLTDGDVLWTQYMPATYSGGIDRDKGPRATPVLVDNRLFAWSAAGVLYCLSPENGDILWKADIAKEWPGGEGYFGYGAGPLILEDVVLINAGSRRAAVIGLDVETGKILWECGQDQASYAAPIAARIGNQAVALFVTRLNFLVIRPQDGQLIASTEFGKRGATVNGASPVLLDQQQVFLNAAYGVGSKVIQLPVKTDVTETRDLTVRWEDADCFASQYTTPVLHEGYLYGTSGREDYNDGQLRCLRVSDGEVIWQQDQWPLAHGIKAGNQLLLLDLNCRLTRLKLSPAGVEILEQRRLQEASTRPLPALANNCLLFRTIGDDDQTRWYCYQLQKSRNE